MRYVPYSDVRALHLYAEHQNTKVLALMRMMELFDAEYDAKNSALIFGASVDMVPLHFAKHRVPLKYS
ncbi:uncharacterized protein PHALS_12270 [Plasmopara halstedii]|uniref:Uncharacterized protein n=1 Tax=Plasmopara halstedii TaxID=4781 RepID=A0A0N7L5N4_PLAHL|nr:uncharacterized protein PHALS_12270 [Plasmopara halstedii]CEG41963.1 hypothetical protein PHALS_12270 [Plasmopara halstedii]|eukprot:XP_024578332.1 hypothetical protein PHALS_12270 [Plasmopara halstedii]